MALTGVKYKPEVRIFCGLPASGKSTEALAWVKRDPARRTRINYDDLRLQMFGKGWVWNRKEEEQVQAQAVELFENAMRLGVSVVIDNTNVSKNVRQKWIDRALAHNIEASVTEFGSHTPIWDLIKRDFHRDARVGRAVIERMALFHGFINWNDKKTYYDKDFVICDIDGTLADITERRKFVQDKGYECNKCGSHYVTIASLTCESCGGTFKPVPKDWKSFFADVSQDELMAPVADLLETFNYDGYRILIVSGRPISPCGIQTEDWLSKHGIPYDHLFMRAGGDHRSDVIVKQEILDLLPKDRIAYVLDDRNSVVEMWRKNGLTCLQVAEGDF